MKTNCSVQSGIPEAASLHGMLSSSNNARLIFFQDGVDKSIGRVERSIAYMIENINRPLQVSTLAALVDLSPSHYFALFKQRKGCSPMHYFTRLRMSHACRLLESTSTNVKQVAMAMGYRDPLYFSRVFKAVNNVPPSRYITVRGGITAMAANRLSSLIS